MALPVPLAVMPASETVKEQVVDQVPKKIKELRFGLFAKQDILRQSALEVCERALFDLDRGRAPRDNGPLDRRLGTASRREPCETCGARNSECSGHFGHVRLALPAFHIGYIRMITVVLQQICKECSRILLPEEDRRTFLRDLRRPNLDNLRRTQVCRKVLERCKKTKACQACGAINGTVKKAGTGALKIVHDKYRAFNASSAAKKQPPRSKVRFDLSFEEAKKQNGEIEKHLKKAMDDLNPLRVLKLFQRISPADCELLGMNPAINRPEMFIWQYIPAPPVIIRPSVSQDNASTEDDITSKLSDIVHISTLIREGLQKGAPTNQIMEQWDFLQLQLALYINSDLPGLQQAGYNKSIRGFCQRLKGKQGRFRGNLSGKRVDFSGRTVISPDPNLSIDEVAVPERVAKILTYPEKVTPHNIEKLRERVRNGPNKHPGAAYIRTCDGMKLSLKYKDAHTPKHVKIGAVVERHLEDGDVVLFNRQPSLHKLSILCHRVKVRPHRTFRLNECVCTPYNADFDGDEMNLHVPQTEEARAEAMELMGVKHNLCTPKNGEPIISAIQDFITGAYLLSSKDIFYDRRTFSNICMSMFNAETHVDLPPPAILKPVALWTGKQIFNVLMRPNKQSQVYVNLDAPNRQYKNVQGQHHDLDENDAWLCIRNSEIMCGRMDKSTVGAGKKNSVFYVILRDFGPDAAVDAMNRLARLSARWLTEQGFSIGISDVYPGERLAHLKTELIEEAYAKCDELIIQFKQGKLQKKAGCDEEMTLENEISGVLNKVRSAAGDCCIEELSKWNAPLIMATSGAKGSTLNVSQMVAVVGQQIIGGKRVEDGFQDRSLPHFPKHARQPPSKGFVQNGFFDGLTPSEFIFHAMSGREGLVDTAVKTAETGYMSRRLMKSLEDLSSQYDDTVRNSSSAIIQFKYGDDMLDPVDMEDKAQPVHFPRTFTHSEALTWDNDEPTLLPYQAIQLCKDLLAGEVAKLGRVSLLEEKLDYLPPPMAEDLYISNKNLWEHTDQSESARSFLESIQTFVNGLAQTQARVRERLGLSPCLTREESLKVRKPRKDQAAAQLCVDRVAKLSKITLTQFVRACLVKHKRAQVEPGHAVGAVGAQSIGEPGTQMTLKTFHFAGVAGMSITEGVPRIKEIINASRFISTPVITCELENGNDVIAARTVKGRIEKTYLKDITTYIVEKWTSSGCVIEMELNAATINALQLSITAQSVKAAIVAQKKLKIEHNDIWVGGAARTARLSILVRELDPPKPTSSAAGAASKPRAASTPAELFPRAGALMRALPDVVIGGYSECSRAVITQDERTGVHRVLVEGYGLRACLGTAGVDARRTTTNSVLETRDVLGVEAARAAIAAEMAAVLRDMDIDPRHLALLADVMTQRGEVLGITRFGLARMRDSVLQLASFEKTTDHLFEAAAAARADRIEGVSECVILGQPIALGTGAFRLVRALRVAPGDIGPCETVFEDGWREEVRRRQCRAAEDTQEVDGARGLER